MKQINKCFKCLACTVVLTLSSTAAFANDPQSNTITDAELERIIKESVDRRTQGILQEIKGRLASEIWDVQDLEVGEVPPTPDAAGTLTPSDEDTLDTGRQETEETVDDSIASDAMIEDYGSSSLLADVAMPLLTIVAFILAIVALFRKNGTKKRSYRQDSDDRPEDTITPLIQKLQSRISAQKGEIDALNKVVEEQNRRILQLQQGQKQGSFEPQTSTDYTKSHNVTGKRTPKETLYASRVASDCFPADSIGTTDSSYAVAVLTVEGDRGTFRINTNPAAQQNLLSTFNYGVALISTTKSQAPSPQKIETLREGKIVREGNAWKITEKAEIRLV